MLKRVISRTDAAQRSGISRPGAPPPPLSAQACLFLDVDGTLIDFAATPGQVTVDPALTELLATAAAKLGGALCLVSGRTLADLDELFDPLTLPAAGVHGLQRRTAQGSIEQAPLSGERLDRAREKLSAWMLDRPGLLLEDKQTALALHFRLAPDAEASAREMLADIVGELTPDFQLLEGDKVFEIKPSTYNKGSAVDAFMREAPFAGRRPVFVGDDYTDRDGFAAVERLGGLSIAVGTRIEGQCRLAGPAAVRQWLSCCVAGFRA